MADSIRERISGVVSATGVELVLSRSGHGVPVSGHVPSHHHAGYGPPQVGDRPGSETTEKTARLTTTVEQIARNEALDGITIKCVESMSLSMGLTPSMIGSLLGDPIPCICENDLPGIIATHIILHKLAVQTVTFLETYEFWKQTNPILLGACGFLPFTMADGPLQVRTFKLSLFEGIGSM